MVHWFCFSLAQAQECICEKSILDHKKPTIIVKVAAQIVEFYKAVNTKVESCKDSLRKTWGSDLIKIIARHSLFKSLFYSSIAYFFYGVQFEDESKWGQALAHFQKADKMLKQSLEPVKNCPLLSKSNAKTAIAFANDVIEGKYQIAKRENEFIYHDRVPDEVEELKVRLNFELQTCAQISFHFIKGTKSGQRNWF